MANAFENLNNFLSNIDSVEEDSATEDLMQREMRQQQQAQQGNDAFQRTRNATKKVLGKPTTLEAVKQGVKLGAYLRRTIRDGSFSSFLIILILSLCKDIPDLINIIITFFDTMLGFTITASVIGPFNVFISVALFIAYFMKRVGFKRWLIRRYIWRYVGVFIIELIPGLNVFPLYTISAILLKRKCDKRIKRLEGELEEVEGVTQKKIFEYKKLINIKNRIQASYASATK